VSKVIYEGMGNTLVEVVPGPVTQLTHFPNLQWTANGVEKLGHLTTTHSKKFPKGFQPGEWRLKVLRDIVPVIDRDSGSVMSEEEIAALTEAVWTAYAHETHGVNTCNSVLPVAAYWQLHFCLPGGIIARARRRNMKDGQYRTNYIGFTYDTPWGEYELVFSTIVSGALDGRWVIEPKLIKEMLALIVAHQYPFLAGIFDNLKVNRWPGHEPVVWADLAGEGKSFTPKAGEPYEHPSSLPVLVDGVLHFPPAEPLGEMVLQANGKFTTQDVERVLNSPCQMTELAAFLGTKMVEIPDELLHLPVPEMWPVKVAIEAGVHPAHIAADLDKPFNRYADVIVDNSDDDLNKSGKVGILK
jgi:hypothetical protein